ncbi:hypothetical protein FS837_003018 [Tulasnella sp. UAMH 9824]|nr:hypothetical protein FS837_003018 [Tulasnella sp. UAMH 9824]
MILSQSPVITSPNTICIPLIPPELWHHVFLILFHGAVEEHGSLGKPGILPKLWCGRAFTSLWLTCRALHEVGEQVRRRLHVIADRSPPKGFLDLQRFTEFHKPGPKPEIIMQGHSVANIIPVAIRSVVGLERMELVNLGLYRAPLQAIIDRDTLRGLKIRDCSSVELSGGFHLSFQDGELLGTIELGGSKVARLELDYTWSFPRISLAVAFLTFIPTLKTLVLCGKSFQGVARLVQSLSLPSLQHLVMTENQPPLPITKADALYYLSRCPTLETLDFGPAIDASTPVPEDILAKLPELRLYEGPAELLPLLNCPRLQHAVVKGCKWDGGTLIHSLATASPVLQILVIELTTRAEDPICKDITVWVEHAASRYSAHQSTIPRFSLILRTAPLGEWIVSAKVGRVDDGCLFIEHIRQRDLTPVNKTSEE